jgi:hypothetical protein
VSRANALIPRRVWSVIRPGGISHQASSAADPGCAPGGCTPSAGLPDCDRRSTRRALPRPGVPRPRSLRRVRTGVPERPDSLPGRLRRIPARSFRGLHAPGAAPRRRLSALVQGADGADRPRDHRRCRAHSRPARREHGPVVRLAAGDRPRAACARARVAEHLRRLAGVSGRGRTVCAALRTPDPRLRPAGARLYGQGVPSGAASCLLRRCWPASPGSPASGVRQCRPRRRGPVRTRRLGRSLAQRGGAGGACAPD